MKPYYSDDEALAAAYRRVKRKPKEGTISAGITAHAQACGLVAYVFNVHPDRVAAAVGEVPAMIPPGELPLNFWPVGEVEKALGVKP